MSLRSRLLISIALMFALSLALGGLLVLRHSVQSVRTEMDAALDVGARTIKQDLAVKDALARHAAGSQDFTDIVDAVNGDRHLRALLTAADGKIVAGSTLAPGTAVPAWFTGLVGVDRKIASFPAGDTGMVLTLQTDPRNEIGEIWGELRDNVGIMALFSVLTFALVYWVVGRTLKPLHVLSGAFAQIGSGDYAAHVAEQGPPELQRLAQGFNGMAERLSVAEGRNRRLHDQLQTLQEEERADLARDLHDEVGPFLFAVNVDAGAIARLAQSADKPEILEPVRSIQQAVDHMQRHVRGILSRLRPVGLSELGLAQALENLAAFWRSRHPETKIAVTVEDGDGFGDTLEAVIYRIVQESLSNAMRHGRPKAVEIKVAPDRDGEIQVTVSDDGAGLPEAAKRSGFGLIGMAERVAAVGGAFAVGNRTEQRGVTVSARFPRDVAA